MEKQANTQNPSRQQVGCAITALIAFVAVIVLAISAIIGPIAKRSNDAIEAARTKCEAHAGYRYIRPRDIEPICVKVLEE